MCSCLHWGCCRLKMIAANGRLESDVTGAGRGESITGEAIQSTSVKVVRAQHPALLHTVSVTVRPLIPVYSF